MNIAKGLIKAGVLAFGCLSFISASYAADAECEAMPDCASLGYDNNADCEEGTYINCPYDISYKKCVNQGCAELGYTQTNKTAWCKAIVYCPTDSSYTLCAQDCGACASGELSPDCDYGITATGLDACGHQCYECKDCDLDAQSGWLTANTECSFSSYVQKAITPSCPENVDSGTRYNCASCPTGTVAPAKNSASCQCNTGAGYYDQCPEGYVCEKISSIFGDCFKTKKGIDGDNDNDGCDESKGYVPADISNSHFTFGDPVVYNIDSVPVTCKLVTGCNGNVDASTTEISDINTVYFKRNDLKLGQTQCYWITGCQDTKVSSCSSVRTFDPTDYAEIGGHTCGTCICDNGQNYYDDCIAGLNCPEVDGCHLREGSCVDPYTSNTSNNHFSYGETSGDCTQVTGCNSNVQGSKAPTTPNVSPYSETYFAVSNATNGGKQCYWVTGCNSPTYTTAASCASSQKLTDKHTAYTGSVECGKCECDTDKGYYPLECPTGATCTYDGYCYKAQKGGDDDQDNDGCNEKDGYVLSSVNDSHFEYGPNVQFKIGNETITCKLVTGCHYQTNASTDRLSDIDTAFFHTTNLKRGQKTCYWIDGCQSPKVDNCNSIALIWDTHEENGGYECGTCKCDEDNNYLKDEPTGQSYTMVSGCYHLDGNCAPGYTTTINTHFNYGNQISGTDCREVLSCNNNVDYSTVYPENISSTYYTSTHLELGGLTCYWITGCKSPDSVASCDDASEAWVMKSYLEKGGKHCELCKCDTENGYTDEPPVGQASTPVDGCYHADGNCVDPYTSTPTDTHFSYGETSGDCTQVTGCKSTNQGSKAPTTPNVSPYSETYFAVSHNTKGGVQCYWVTGCKSPYKQASECQSYEYLSGGQTSYTGGPVCGTCACDTTQNYYPIGSSPAGSVYETVGNCEHVLDGCANPYTSDTSNDHFSYGETSGNCTQVTGCKSTNQGSKEPTTPNVSPYSETYFAVSNATNGGKQCYWVTGCNSPTYTTAASCASSQKLTDKHTAYTGSVECGKCECDTDNGYYPNECPTGATCTYDGHCYQTQKGGNDDQDENGCNEAEGYIPANITAAYFTYGSNVEFKVGTETITCKKVTGCAGSYVDSENPGCAANEYAADTQGPLGGKTCVLCAESACSAGNAPSGGCPTGYKSGSTVVETKGTLNCYACECDSSQGYYTYSEKSAKTGVSFTTKTKTDYPTCYAYSSCNSTPGYYSLTSSQQSVFGYDTSTSVTTTSGTTATCYHVDRCINGYTKGTCGSNTQEFLSTTPLQFPATIGTVTCRDCRTIPNCTLPHICHYATVYGTTLNLQDTNFKNALEAYKTCMSGFTMTAGCTDMGLKTKTTLTVHFVYAPNGENCRKISPSTQDCQNFDCVDDFGGQTQEPNSAGWHYEEISLYGSGKCYVNVIAKTCTEQAGSDYPYASQPTCLTGNISSSTSGSYWIGDSYQKCYGSCTCNTAKGYYENQINTTGLSSNYDTSSTCYYATCDTTNKWILSPSTWEGYDQTQTYIQKGTTTTKTCHHITGCATNYAAADRNTTYFKYTEETITTGDKCYVEQTSCQTGYSDVSSLTNLANYDYATSVQTGKKCGKLDCDNTAGAYNSNPSTTAFAGTTSDNCFWLSGCKSGYIDEGYAHYSDVVVSSTAYGPKTTTSGASVKCHQFTKCKYTTGTAGTSQTKIDTAVFNYSTFSVDSNTCPYPTSCKYVTSGTPGTGQTLIDTTAFTYSTKTVGSLTCPYPTGCAINHCGNTATNPTVCTPINECSGSYASAPISNAEVDTTSTMCSKIVANSNGVCQTAQATYANYKCSSGYCGNTATNPTSCLEINTCQTYYAAAQLPSNAELDTSSAYCQRRVVSPGSSNICMSAVDTRASYKCSSGYCGSNAATNPAQCLKLNDCTGKFAESEIPNHAEVITSSQCTRRTQTNGVCNTSVFTYQYQCSDGYCGSDSHINPTACYEVRTCDDFPYQDTGDPKVSFAGYGSCPKRLLTATGKCSDKTMWYDGCDCAAGYMLDKTNPRSNGQCNCHATKTIQVSVSRGSGLDANCGDWYLYAKGLSHVFSGSVKVNIIWTKVTIANKIYYLTDGQQLYGSDALGGITGAWGHTSSTGSTNQSSISYTASNGITFYSSNIPAADQCTQSNGYNTSVPSVTFYIDYYDD